MIGVKGKQLCDINHWNQCKVTLTFNLEINRGHPRLMGIICVKFHDDRCKGKAIMRHKPFSGINAT